MGILEDLKKSLGEIGGIIADDLTPSFTTAWGNMADMSTALNNTFGQNRQRIIELRQAIGDTIPVITKLGGSVNDTFSTLQEVSEATKRNVIASAEDASKLYAASQILGTSVKTIVGDFTKVGVQFSQIGPQLEKSINNVQNLGLNTKQIFEDVGTYMSKLNEFNFRDGVEGLTKMAANAAIFRFDMRETFNLADRAMKPEGAIALASAFQRMGVAAADLTDPFQLMYKSLNDPGGLQDSLANMTQQYVEFDEKTKTFQINPMGILQMRELASQTDMNYTNLLESAKAVANLNRALGEIRPEINFESEDDKKLLANISRMNEQGEYVVNVKNELGEKVPQKLSDLTQPQINEIIKLQKEQGKMKLEEIAINQLDAQVAASSNLAAIRQKLEYGLLSAPSLSSINERARDATIGFTNKLEKLMMSPSEMRPKTQGAIDQLSDLLQKLAKGEITEDDINNKFTELTKGLDNLEKMSVGTFKQVVQDFKTEVKNLTTGSLKTDVSPGVKVQKQSKSITNTVKVNYGGSVTLKIDAGPGTNKNDLERYLNSPEFKKLIYDVISNLDDNAKRSLGLSF